LDALKLLVAVAIIAAGVAGFYLFEEYRSSCACWPSCC